jgi:hypothetical protein
MKTKTNPKMRVVLSSFFCFSFVSQVCPGIPCYLLFCKPQLWVLFSWSFENWYPFMLDFFKVNLLILLPFVLFALGFSFLVCLGGLSGFLKFLPFFGTGFGSLLKGPLSTLNLSTLIYGRN